MVRRRLVKRSIGQTTGVQNRRCKQGRKFLPDSKSKAHSRIKYDTAIDRESAFEKLAQRAATAAAKAAASKKTDSRKRAHVGAERRVAGQRQSIAETFVKSVVREASAVSTGTRAGARYPGIICSRGAE